jgi:hypothetical protein
MTTATDEPARALTAAEGGFNCPQLYAATIALVALNAVAAKVLQAFVESPPAGVLIGGLGANWTFWLALASCLRLAWTEAASPIRPVDRLLCGGVALCALVPIPQLSSLAATGLSLAILFDRQQGVRLKAAAIVLLAITVQILWSRILMLFFLGPVTSFDAHAVSFLIQRPVHGADVDFADGSRHRLSILAGCTSVQNASAALALFTAVVRGVRPAPRLSEAAIFAAVFATVVAINLIRLVMMTQSLTMYHLVHDGPGWNTTEAIITAAALAWALWTVRREI